MLFIDFETFAYDWLCVAIDPIEKNEFVIINDREELNQLYKKYKNDIWVGYNIRNYDQYILKAILLGFEPKRVNDWIIVKDRKGFEYSSLFNKVRLNIFDVIPNPPVSLKTLEAFMGNSIHETSVPFDIDRKLTTEEIQETVRYCRFDVMNTIEVFLRRKNEFDSHLDSRLITLEKLKLNLQQSFLALRRNVSRMSGLSVYLRMCSLENMSTLESGFLILRIIIPMLN